MAMVKLIEEDADSFAQRAEMYYKKRPELLSMMEDLYRAYRSLAEKYDQLKSEGGLRTSVTQLGSLRLKDELSNPHSLDKSSESSNDYDSFETEESEIEDPDRSYEVTSKEEESDEGSSSEQSHHLIQDMQVRFPNESDSATATQLPEGAESNEDSEGQREQLDILGKSDLKLSGHVKPPQLPSKQNDVEVRRLKEEIRKLREESRVQKAEILQRNGEKREAIRQLCIFMEGLRDENKHLRNCLFSAR